MNMKMLSNKELGLWQHHLWDNMGTWYYTFIFCITWSNS